MFIGRPVELWLTVQGEGEKCSTGGCRVEISEDVESGGALSAHFLSLPVTEGDNSWCGESFYQTHWDILRTFTPSPINSACLGDLRLRL